MDEVILDYFDWIGFYPCNQDWDYSEKLLLKAVEDVKNEIQDEWDNMNENNLIDRIKNICLKYIKENYEFYSLKI